MELSRFGGRVNSESSWFPTYALAGTGLCPEDIFDDPEHLEENPCILEGLTVTADLGDRKNGESENFAGALFLGNVVAAGVTVGWLYHAYRARQGAQPAGSPPALFNAFFRENIREAVTINLATPGGIWNTGSGGVTVFQDPSWMGATKAAAGFFPVAGALVSGYDMLDVCGWI